MFIDRLEKTACVNEELILIDTRLAVLKYGVMVNQAIINLYTPTSYRGIRVKCIRSGNNLPITGNLKSGYCHSSDSPAGASTGDPAF